SADDHRFTTLPTNRAELARLIAKHRPDVVLIEACLLAGWVRDLCVDQGVRCLVANTAGETWKFKHLQRNTHRDDALRQTPHKSAEPNAVRCPKAEMHRLPPSTHLAGAQEQPGHDPGDWSKGNPRGGSGCGLTDTGPQAPWTKKASIRAAWLAAVGKGRTGS